jgi:hypothetical protein
MTLSQSPTGPAGGVKRILGGRKKSPGPRGRMNQIRTGEWWTVLVQIFLVLSWLLLYFTNWGPWHHWGLSECHKASVFLGEDSPTWIEGNRVWIQGLLYVFIFGRRTGQSGEWKKTMNFCGNSVTWSSEFPREEMALKMLSEEQRGKLCLVQCTTLKRWARNSKGCSEVTCGVWDRECEPSQDSRWACSGGCWLWRQRDMEGGDIGRVVLSIQGGSLCVQVGSTDAWGRAIRVCILGQAHKYWRLEFY